MLAKQCKTWSTLAENKNRHIIGELQEFFENKGTAKKRQTAPGLQ